MWYKRQKHYSSKIAVDLSHYRLLERIAASNSNAVILEDDVQLTGKQWLLDLLTTLQELPQVGLTASVIQTETVLLRMWPCQRVGAA